MRLKVFLSWCFFPCCIGLSGIHPHSVTERMSWISQGEFWMGCGEEVFGIEDCRPQHKILISGFWMDKFPATNEEFEDFVKNTDYRTVAERPPSPDDFPGIPKEKLLPGSIVFQPTVKPVPLTDHSRWWKYVAGADWKHPEGQKTSLKGRRNHPVVHMAWEDANAYCKWKGKRLPTEAEWEFAARGGLDRKRYAWGNELRPNGKWMANIWQGQFPCTNTLEDKFNRTSPVGAFPANGYGLYDVAGNVWEWTSDWYRPDTYQRSKYGAAQVRDPQGPEESFDPAEPGVPKRVHRGGSFLCSEKFCSRYLVGARGKAEPTSSASHTGFRCAKSAEIASIKPAAESTICEPKVEGDNYENISIK